MELDIIIEKYKYWKTTNYRGTRDNVQTYLMRDGDSKYYKIGKSKNPPERLKNLRLSNHRLTLVCYGDGYSECYLHSMYSDKRIEREFFELEDEDVKFIKDNIGLENNIEVDCPIMYTIKSGKFKGKTLYDMLSRDGIAYIYWFVTKGRSEVKKGIDKSKDELYALLDEWVRFLDSSLGTCVKYSRWKYYKTCLNN